MYRKILGWQALCIAVQFYILHVDWFTIRLFSQRKIDYALERTRTRTSGPYLVGNPDADEVEYIMIIFLNFRMRENHLW